MATSNHSIIINEEGVLKVPGPRQHRGTFIGTALLKKNTAIPGVQDRGIFLKYRFQACCYLQQATNISNDVIVIKTKKISNRDLPPHRHLLVGCGVKYIACLHCLHFKQLGRCSLVFFDALVWCFSRSSAVYECMTPTA